MVLVMIMIVMVAVPVLNEILLLLRMLKIVLLILTMMIDGAWVEVDVACSFVIIYSTSANAQYNDDDEEWC